MIELYGLQPLFVDSLPYTQIFANLHEVLNAETNSNYHQHSVFGMLMRLRKLGRLPHKKE